MWADNHSKSWKARMQTRKENCFLSKTTYSTVFPALHFPVEKVIRYRNQRKNFPFLRIAKTFWFLDDARLVVMVLFWIVYRKIKYKCWCLDALCNCRRITGYILFSSLSSSIHIIKKFHAFFPFFLTTVWKIAKKDMRQEASWLVCWWEKYVIRTSSIVAWSSSSSSDKM